MQHRIIWLRLNKLQRGVGMFELILFLAIILSITPIVAYQISLYNKRRLGQQYTGQTIAYAKAFSRYLHDYKVDCTKQPIITYDDLKQNKYLPIGMENNITKYGKPQVSCTKDASSNTIQALMYYYDQDYTKDQREKDVAKLLFAKDAAMGIGGEAGVYRNSTSLNQNEKQIVGIGGAWSIKNTDLPSSVQQDEIPENSLVVNLAMMPDYATMIVNPSRSVNGANSGNGNKAGDDTVSANTDNYLYRVKDTSGMNAGDVNHTNTMQADITVANKDNVSEAVVKYHSIRFTADKNGPILTSAKNPDLPRELRQSGDTSQVALSGGLITGNLQPTETHEIGESCEPEDVGKIVKHKLGDSRYIPEFSRIALLTCKYANFNNMKCKEMGRKGDRGYQSGYCYLPINNVGITYHIENSKIEEFDCRRAGLSEFGYIDISSDVRSILYARANGQPKVCFTGREEFYGGVVAYTGINKSRQFDAISITCTIEPVIRGKDTSYDRDCL